jgi:AraC family transcriptional regulator of adaptative response/methylated-DNA-[protein]-cysteine methyltransferase
MSLVMDKPTNPGPIDMHPTEQDPRWAAVVARDPASDGKFIYSVRSTGIYCRPTCPSRRAKPENVAFHATWQDAERAGFRACARCHPKTTSRREQNAEIIAAACRQIEQAEELPPLADLAVAAGVSPYHFHRLFKAATGLTPKAYGVAHRARRVREGLEVGAGSVTDAIYDAGFGSSSRFYEASDKMLGMTPTAFRKGGSDTVIKFAIGECSLGSILVAATGKGVCAILLGDDPETLARDLQDRFPNAKLEGGDTAFEKLMARAVGLVDAPAIGGSLPLDVRGTAFQQRVGQALRDIPSGATATYSEIAHRIGAPKAVRAVAQACAANPTAVAIPCHRVVRTDGSLSGYRWGVERKRALLAKEAHS